MKIKAAVVYEKGGPFIIEELELSEPREDEVIVRIVGAGICHTDLSARDQHLPLPLPGVFGHEGAGIVEKIGSRVTKVQPETMWFSAGDPVWPARPAAPATILIAVIFFYTIFMGRVRMVLRPCIRANG